MADSRSNYSLTPFSVSSCFDMNYLHFRESIKKIDLKTYLSAVDYAGKTTIPKYFAARGYQLVNESIFTIAEISPQQPPYDIWDQNLVFSRQHFFWKIYSDIGWKFPSFLPVKDENADRQLRARRDADLDANLQYLNRTIDTTSSAPRFVYAHFLVPHGPYSRGANGEELPFDAPDLEQERMKSYVRQVQYTNGIIRSLVSKIIDNAKRPLVVMVIGDHGYRFEGEKDRALEFSNLNAVYFSNKNYSQFRKDQSLVNNFRVVLNSYFGESLPLIRDSSIYLPYK